LGAPMNRQEALGERDSGTWCAEARVISLSTQSRRHHLACLGLQNATGGQGHQHPRQRAVCVVVGVARAWRRRDPHHGQRTGHAVGVIPASGFALCVTHCVQLRAFDWLKIVYNVGVTATACPPGVGKPTIRTLKSRRRKARSIDCTVSEIEMSRRAHCSSSPRARACADPTDTRTRIVAATTRPLPHARLPTTLRRRRSTALPRRRSKATSQPRSRRI